MSEVRAGGASPAPAASRRSSGAGSAYRADVQGLRALAVVLVVLDHAGLGPFPGGFIGVDVFFVVSGFLITGLLLAEAERHGRVSLTGFYARRARRILPAATLVLAATAVAGFWWLNGIQALRLLKDTVWATFFAANVKFARDETDYWARDEPASPIQHFWSLAVEEQFYLVWPLLVLLVASVLAARGTAHRLRGAVGVVVLGLSLGSFGWAVVATGADPHGSYFDTLARAWELGAGAVLAAAVRPVARLPRSLLAAASWVGLAMVLVAAVSFGAGARVPGPPALLPVLGTALLLAGGTGAAAWGPQRLLAVAPARWVGDRSYSFYLWHWPALVLATAVWGRLDTGAALAVVAGALLLSDASYRWVEEPFRTARRLHAPVRGLVLYPASVAALGLVVLTTHAAVLHVQNQPRPPVSVEHYGQQPGEHADFAADPRVALVQASVLAARNGMEVPNPLRPRALGLADRVAADLEGCEYAGVPRPMPLCERGDVTGEHTLVMVGDSHTRHWIPPVEALAERHGYRAYYFPLAGCTPALVQPWSPVTDAPDTDCTFFHEWTQEQIDRLRPDVVIMSTDTQRAYVTADGTRVDDKREVAAMIEQGMAARVRALRPLTERVVVLADVPRLRFDPSVVSERGATLADGLSEPSPRSMLMRRAVKRAALAEGAEHIETARWFCAWGACPVVVGDYITRRDRGHLTLEYAASLVEPLGRALGLDDAATRVAAATR